MDGINGFAIAVSQLDQERHRLAQERARQREIMQQQRELFEMEKRKHTLEMERVQLENETLRTKQEAATKAREKSQALMQAWQAHVAASQLPDDEIKDDVTAGIESRSYVRVKGNKAKRAEAEAAFRSSLADAAAAAPEAVSILFSTIEGLSRLESLPERSRLEMEKMRADIASSQALTAQRMGGGAVGLKATAEMSKAASESYLKGAEVLDKEINFENREQIRTRHKDRIESGAATLSQLATNTNQLTNVLSSQLVTFADLADLTPNAKAAASSLKDKTDRILDVMRAGGDMREMASSLIQDASELEKYSTASIRVVGEGPRRAQLDQLRANLAEYRNAINTISRNHQAMEDEIHMHQKKQEWAVGRYDDLIKGGMDPYVAARTAGVTVRDLFAQASGIESDLELDPTYTKALSTTSTSDEQAAALSLISNKVSGETEDAVELRKLLISRFSQRKRNNLFGAGRVIVSPTQMK